jgi:CRP/FNR family transcriptional regulator, anaerobic regulatory protein
MPTRHHEAGGGTWHLVKPTLPLPPLETYERGVDLTLQGEVASYVYFVVQGAVKLARICSDGRECIVGLAFAGDLVGAQSAILERKCSDTAITLSRSSLARWGKSQFLARFCGSPAFSLEASRILCRQMCRLECRISELEFQTARQRLEALLRYWPGIEISGGGLAGGFRLPLSRVDIGQLLGVTPYHVSRLLTALERDRVIARRGRHIWVPPAAPRRAVTQ